MNDKELEKIKEISASISLSVDEKNDLREKIISQMKAVELKQERTQHSKRIWFAQFLQPRLVPSFAVALIFVLSSGGIAAAQVSLPGNPLYGIKVNVNEKVKGIFMVSLEDKAQREIELVSRRLEETRSLALAEKLTPEARGVIENQLEKHTEKVKEYIKTSENKNDISQAINLQLQLEIAFSLNEKVLTKIETVSSEVSPVVAKVRREISSVSEEKSILQNDLSVGDRENENISIIAKDRLEAAKTVTEVAEGLVNQGIPQFEGSGYEDQINLVKQDIQKGESLLEEGSYQEAIQYFDKSLKNSSEIKFLIENFDQEEANRVFIKNKTLQLGLPDMGTSSDTGEPQIINDSGAPQNQSEGSVGKSIRKISVPNPTTLSSPPAGL